MTAQPVETCIATNRAGARCRKRPEPGMRVCRMHGGATPNAKAGAAVRLLEAKVAGEVTKRGWEPLTDPLAAYADLTGEVWAFKELCREQLAALRTWDYSDLKAAEDIKPIVAVYERALDRAAKALVDMMRLGLDAAALRQAKERPSREQAEALSRVLDTMLGALDLTDEQRRRVPAALADALRTEGLL